MGVEAAFRRLREDGLGIGTHRVAGVAEDLRLADEVLRRASQASADRRG